MALAGTETNRSAIGERVIVEAGGRRQMDEVMSGGSYYSHNEMALYFDQFRESSRGPLAKRRRSGMEGYSS